MRVGKSMTKFMVFFQYFVISLLLIGAILFLFQKMYLQSGVYAALGALFLGYVLLEKKKHNQTEKV